MNKLLPKIEDLFPITDDRKTFSGTPFNDDFNKLSFKSKLQIINDIIRQTMMYNPIPNTKEDVETLVGDSYTASLSAIDYLKSLNIGCNYRTVLARKKVYDPDDINAEHIITLVDDPETNETYQFDSTPVVGYKCGKVDSIKNNRYYEEYVEITGEIKELLENMRTIAYKLSTTPVEKNKTLVNGLKNILEEAKQYSILNSYTSKYYFLLSQKTTDKEFSQYCLNKSELLNPYLSDMNEENARFVYKKARALEYVKRMNEELKELISSDTDYPRQIELAQTITKILDEVYNREENSLTVNGSSRRFSYLSPRFFLENGLNVVLIKPSSFKLGVQASIKESFLRGGNGAIGEYNPDLGNRTNLGIRPMTIFHPHGYKYERSMSGPTDLFLVKGKADDILKKKREIRNTFGQKLNNHEVLWYDGTPIEWDPIITNLVHSTDDPSEACMHYLCAYPEYQLMTRFMYPNPVLAKEEKHGRIRV